MTDTDRPDASRRQICRPTVSTRAQIAKLMNVSERSMRMAGIVLDCGIPELIKAVEKGDMAVSLACEIALAPAEVQRLGVAAGWTEQKRLARKIKGMRLAARQEGPSRG